MLEKYHRDEKLPQGYRLKNLPEFATGCIYTNLPQQRLGNNPKVCKEIKFTRPLPILLLT